MRDAGLGLISVVWGLTALYIADAETRRNALINKNFFIFLYVLVLDSKRDQMWGLSSGNGVKPFPNTYFSKVGHVIS
jgi:hypothetical protein